MSSRRRTPRATPGSWRGRSGRRPWASGRCTSARPSASTGRRWSRASSRSRTAACATRTCSPGSYDPAARVKEIIEDETDAEVIFNGVGDGVERDQAVPRQGARPGVLQGLQRLDRRVPGLRARALHLQRHVADHGPRRTASPSCERCAGLGLRTVQLESYPSGSFFEPTPEDDRFWAAAVELGMPINVHTQFFFPVGDLGSKHHRRGRPPTARAGQEPRPRRRGGQLPGDLGQDDHHRACSSASPT